MTSAKDFLNWMQFSHRIFRIQSLQPWDDETDMAKLEESVRSITMDGLLWGTGKLVAVGYGKLMSLFLSKN